MEDSNSLRDLFLAINLDPKVVENTLKNKKVSMKLKEVIDVAGIKEASKQVGNLLYQLATKAPESVQSRMRLLTDYILNEKINKPMQLDEAIKYL